MSGKWINRGEAIGIVVGLVFVLAIGFPLHSLHMDLVTYAVAMFLGMTLPRALGKRWDRR